MAQSRGFFEVCLEGLSGMDEGAEDIYASASEGDDGLVVSFPFAACDPAWKSDPLRGGIGVQN